MRQDVTGSKQDPHTTDGRNIDPSVGVLSGEAAGQSAGDPEAAWKNFPLRLERQVPDQRFDSAEPTYYDLPVLKKTVWTPDIPLYYFTGGLAGAAAVIGAAATLLSEKDELRELAQFARTLAFGGSMLGTVFLIHDLGKPSRFLFMLRVFRPTSPMNLGTWFFTGFGGAATATWAASRGWLPKFLDKPAYAVAGVFGMALSGYTAVLIANTAVPLWQGAYRTLPFLFVASSAASAGSALEFTGLDEREKRIVAQFASFGEIAKLAASVALEYEVGRSSRAIRPLREGLTGLLWQAARACTAISLGVSTFAAETTRSRRIAAVFGLAGSLLLRFAIHEGGKKSALDARATFDQQRRGLGGMEVTGIAAEADPPGVRAIAAD